MFLIPLKINNVKYTFKHSDSLTQFTKNTINLSHKRNAAKGFTFKLVYILGGKNLVFHTITLLNFVQEDILKHTVQNFSKKIKICH